MFRNLGSFLHPPFFANRACCDVNARELEALVFELIFRRLQAALWFDLKVAG